MTESPRAPAEAATGVAAPVACPSCAAAGGTSDAESWTCGACGEVVVAGYDGQGIPLGGHPDLPTRGKDAVRAAATIIVLADDTAGALRVLLVQRSARMAFFPGAWVFPGGAVDDEDRTATAAAADAPLLARVEAAARHAAVRELREETGMSVVASTLVPLSHWTTPPARPRRFSTWFFLAPYHATADVTPDAQEVTGFGWHEPREALTAAAEGTITLAGPTFVTLEQLARARDVGSALALPRTDGVACFLPRSVTTPQGNVSLFAGDHAYATDLDATLDRSGPRHRLDQRRTPWVYERSQP